MQQLYRKQGLELDNFDSVIKWIFKNLYRLLGSLLVIYVVVQAWSGSVFMDLKTLAQFQGNEMSSGLFQDFMDGYLKL